MCSEFRGFRDRDYIETVEGLFFTVVGNIHPRGFVLAYLKYIPSREGIWGNNKRRFKRALPYYTVPMLLDTINFLKKSYPHYVGWVRELGVEMSMIPIHKIQRHHKPEERLREILKGPKDQLEGMVADLTRLISEEGGVPMSFLGVTGSVLIGIHRPFSDIDLVVYGRENSIKVRETLKRLYEEPKGGIAGLTKERFNELLDRRQRLFYLSKTDAELICSRKWNRGTFMGRDFSIHPVKRDDEVSELFEDVQYKPLGLATIRGTVVEDSDSIFMPSRWGVEVSEFIEGPRVAGVSEVCSYEGLYMGVVEKGELFEAKGKIEEVYKHGELSHYRLLIGSPEARGVDYIKPLRSASIR
ncbi:MAG: hypothetical protein QFX33_01130 [Candidatus Nezhaarchaeota archaeon]|nr:hypothetical protein [Candidatus Nezhaarchaeota archaeon]